MNRITFLALFVGIGAITQADGAELEAAAMALVPSTEAPKAEAAKTNDEETTRFFSSNMFLNPAFELSTDGIPAGWQVEAKTSFKPSAGPNGSKALELSQDPTQVSVFGQTFKPDLFRAGDVLSVNFKALMKGQGTAWLRVLLLYSPDALTPEKNIAIDICPTDGQWHDLRVLWPVAQGDLDKLSTVVVQLVIEKISAPLELAAPKCSLVNPGL